MYQGEENQGGETDLLTKLNAAISLTKVMPPSKLKKNLIGLINLAPELEDNLLEKIDIPMQIDNSDPDHPYLKTEFNRDGNAYRSPFTNQYDNMNQNSYRPSGHYRQFEETGNVMFNEYIKLYYGNAVGSFYVLESDEGNNNFSCGFFAKKGSKDEEGFEGNWDSFNIVDITTKDSISTYKLTSTVLIEMNIEYEGINLTGFMKKTKQQKRQFVQNTNEEQIFSSHLETVGQMIEDQQTNLRQHLEAIYVGKTKEIIFTTRWENSLEMERNRMSLAQDLKKIRFGS